MYYQTYSRFFSQDFFSNYSNDLIMMIAFFAIISFLIGFLLARIASNRIIKKQFNQLSRTSQDLNNLQMEHSAIKEHLELQTADLQKSGLENNNLLKQFKNITEEKTALQNELFQANEQLDKINTTNQSYLGTLEDLNNQIIGLKAQNLEFLNQPNFNTQEDHLSQYKKLQQDHDNTLQRLDSVENRMNLIHDENEILRVELDRLKSKTKPIIEKINAKESSSNKKLDPEQDKQSFQIDSITPNTQLNKDDLTIIEGIGPFIENKLNELGIISFEQISRLDQESIDLLTKAIEFFPGRIHKDDWVGQAKTLIEMTSLHNKNNGSITENNILPNIDTEVSNPNNVKKQSPSILDHRIELSDANPYKNREDDLKIIEGIGPKIAQLLVDDGIDTWQKLAESTPTQIREILNNGGRRFKMHDPESWPQQAQFAFDRNWQKLSEFQNYLTGGRSKK